MKQVALNGTKRYEGMVIIVWAPDSMTTGDTVRWNGFPWRVGTCYSTRFCLDGYWADKRERPREQDPGGIN